VLNAQAAGFSAVLLIDSASASATGELQPPGLGDAAVTIPVAMVSSEHGEALALQVRTLCDLVPAAAAVKQTRKYMNAPATARAAGIPGPAAQPEPGGRRFAREGVL
jgi:hypothetical protein